MRGIPIDLFPLKLPGFTLLFERNYLGRLCMETAVLEERDKIRHGGARLGQKCKIGFAANAC